VERLSSEDFSLAFQGAAPLKLSKGGTLSDYNLHTLLVDPPRAGMDERTYLAGWLAASTLGSLIVLLLSCLSDWLLQVPAMSPRRLTGWYT
jgi:hypothetical protein